MLTPKVLRRPDFSSGGESRRVDLTRWDGGKDDFPKLKEKMKLKQTTTRKDMRESWEVP